MTNLKRTFDLETRTLKSKDRCYVGQVYDHISTTLEFSYNPINALTDGGYTAYIMFDLYDDNGDIFVFGPGSSPRFDGRTFEIPTSVTSRITTQRLEYQIWLVKNRTEWNGRIEELGDTEYLFSAKDSLAFKPTTRCRCPSRDPCRPPQPDLEPGTLGWVTYLRDHAVLTPFVETYGTLEDGTEGVTLHIPTYNEDRDQDLILHIPYLDSEGLIDIHTFLRIVEEYNPEATHDQIMTALCVQNLLEDKLDKDSVISEWSEAVGKDIAVPDAGLVKAELSKKADSIDPIPVWNPETVFGESSVVVFDQNLYLSLKADNVGHSPSDPEWWSTVMELDSVVDTWDVSKEPWAGYANDPFKTPSARLSRLRPIAPWDAGISYEEDSVVLHGGILYVSTADNNLGHEPFVSDIDPDKTTTSDPVWWSPVRGVPESGGQYSDSSTTYNIIGGDPIIDETTGMCAYDVPHPYNTRNLFISARTFDPENASRSYLFDALFDVSSPKKVRVLTNKPLAPESAVIYISPGGGGDVETVFRTIIGDGSTKVFDIAHNLGIADVFVCIRDLEGHLVQTNMRSTGPGTVRLTFAHPPDEDSLFVTVCPAIQAQPSTENSVFEFRTPSKEWVVDHNLHKIVSVQTYDSRGIEIIGSVVQDLVSYDSVTVRFNQEFSGFMVVRG